MRAVAKLRGSMEIPIGAVNVKEITKALTIKYRPMGAAEPVEVQAYRLTDDAIHVPREYGIDLCHRLGIDWEDHTSPGTRVKFPRVPAPRPYQVGPLEEIESNFKTEYDFIFRARTGWGKTIGSLILASRIGVATIILVDQENLKKQWVDTLTGFFGFKKEDIGIIQGKVLSFANKAVTIAMVQTLTRKAFPQEVYNRFGLVIVDEVHIIGAPTFHRVLLDFSASYRLGVSATPKRRDGLQKLLDYNLGRPRVWVEDEHEESAVYVTEHHSVYSAYANKATKIGRFITEVTDDGSRNLLTAECAAYLYDTGRDVLVLSDRIEHLNELMTLCEYLGIPAEEMGVYAGYRPVYGWVKDPTPERRPVGWVRGTEYTPVHLTLISKRAKEKDLEHTKTTARIIFATYGKFAKGVDEPRLCAGVDASPRSTSEQMQGRILRGKAKFKPIWITINDPNNYRAVFALAQRIPDYLKNNAVISKWSLEGGKTKCNAHDLRRELLAEVARQKKFMQIETSSDGLNTLVTVTQQMQQEHQRATGTTVGVRRRVLPTGSSRAASPAR